MKNPSLGDRLQPSPNLRHIVADTAPKQARTRGGNLTTLTSYQRGRLADQRALLAQLRDVDATLPYENFDSWRELKSAGISIFEDFIQSHSEKLSATQSHAILHAGTAGIGSIGAFLEVIPEVNDTPAPSSLIAQQSLRTLMWWSSLSDTADAGLNCAIATSDISSRVSTRERYTALTYDPQFFHITPEQTLELDRETLEPYAAQIDRGLKGTDVYYGCPFRRDLPKLYNAMLTAATRSELL